MATITYQVSTKHNIYPNLTIYDRFVDGVQNGWRVNANEGYVFYDITANDVELDPETMEERPVTYYYTVMSLNRNHDWSTFSQVAVPRDSVDENYIFDINNDDRDNA